MLPLIDIVFLVLVFFIYAMLSMAVHRGLPVILPSSSTAKIDKTIVLSVTVILVMKRSLQNASFWSILVIARSEMTKSAAGGWIINML